MNILVTGNLTKLSPAFFKCISSNSWDISILDLQADHNGDDTNVLHGSWMQQDDFYNALLAQDALVFVLSGVEGEASWFQPHLVAHLSNGLKASEVDTLFLAIVTIGRSQHPSSLLGHWMDSSMWGNHPKNHFVYGLDDRHKIQLICRSAKQEALVFEAGILKALTCSGDAHP